MLVSGICTKPDYSDVVELPNESDEDLHISLSDFERELVNSFRRVTGITNKWTWSMVTTIYR
jgi:hypothetical protein